MAGLEGFSNRNSILDYTLGNRSLKRSQNSFQNKTFQNFQSTSFINSENTILDNNPDNATALPAKTNEGFRIFIIIIIVGGILLAAGIITFCVLYFGVMVKTPTYKDACTTTNPCTSNIGLYCDVTCKCPTNSTYWDGFRCSNLLSFGSQCYGGTFQCQSGLSCVNNLCQCSNSSFYSNTNRTCILKLDYNAPCTTCSYSSTCPNCMPCTQCKNDLNLYCDTGSSKCSCNTTTHYYDTFTSLCKPKVSYNYYCTSDSSCQVQSTGLFCQTGLTGSSCPFMPSSFYCNCPNGTYWNGTICKTPEFYYANCVGNCSCDTTKLLYCNMQTSDYRCLCPNGYYWDSSSLRCLVQMTYNSPCVSSNQCLLSKGLTCASSVCQCGAFTGSWFWSSYASTCVECPSGWTFISSSNKCIKAFYDYKEWSNAQLLCQQFLGNLIIINDLITFNITKYLILRTDSMYWIGAGDSRTEGTFRWTFDGSLIDNTILPWCTTPNGGYYENCLYLSPTSWCVTDDYCTNGYYYICQKII